MHEQIELLLPDQAPPVCPASPEQRTLQQLWPGWSPAASDHAPSGAHLHAESPLESATKPDHWARAPKCCHASKMALGAYCRLRSETGQLQTGERDTDSAQRSSSSRICSEEVAGRGN